MINAARTNKLRTAVLFVAIAAVLVAMIFVVGADSAWIFAIAFALCVPFMGVLQLGMWAATEAGLPKPAAEERLTSAQLIDQLESFNDERRPFEVRRDGNELIASWKLSDSTWWELFSREGFQAYYRLHLLLDASGSTVRAIELITKRHTRIGKQGASFEYDRFRGWSLFHKEYERSYGIKKLFPLDVGKVNQLDLDTRAFREPILDAVADAGWRILPCTYSLRAGL